MTTAISTGIQIRLGEAQDETQIHALLRDCSLGKGIQLTLERKPFFPSLVIHGENSQALVAEDTSNGRIVALAVRGEKECFVNGRSQATGYLGLCRIHSNFRNGRILASGFRFLRALHRNGTAPFYLTTIAEDNTAAVSLLRSGRAGLPSYHPMGRIRSFLIRPSQFRRFAGPASVTVRPASKAYLPELLAFLEREGSKRQFFPRYRESDFDRGGLLQDLAVSDIFVARNGARVIGTLAVWDQRAYKQLFVRGYGRGLRAIRPGYNLLASLRDRPTLPDPGCEIPSLAAAMLCIEKDDPKILRSLLRASLEALHRRDSHSLFVLSLHESDPLLGGMQTIPCWKYGSLLFLAHWSDGAPAIQGLDGRALYLETGAL